MVDSPVTRSTAASLQISADFGRRPDSGARAKLTWLSLAYLHHVRSAEWVSLVLGLNDVQPLKVTKAGINQDDFRETPGNLCLLNPRMMKSLDSCTTEYH